VNPPRNARTRLRRILEWCIASIVVVLIVKYGPTLVMYYALYNASSVEVSYIARTTPGMYDTVSLTGSDMATFCAEMKKDTYPMYLQVRAVVSNLRVRAFDQTGAEIASIGIYPMGEKGESLDTLLDLAKKGTRVERRRPTDSPWTIHMMRQAR
jgi:hypothetical protein